VNLNTLVSKRFCVPCMNQSSKNGVGQLPNGRYSLSTRTIGLHTDITSVSYRVTNRKHPTYHRKLSHSVTSIRLDGGHG
jgi:hypothetical protein